MIPPLDSLSENPFPHTEPAPFVHVYKSSFDGHQIISILENDINKPKWGAARVGGAGNQQIGKHRDSRVLPLEKVLSDPTTSDTDLATLNDLMYEAERAIWDYRTIHDLELTRNPGWTINKYGHGGEYKIHCDHGSSDPRVLSCLVYLNTVKDGGGTVFPFLDFSTPCIEGTIVLFPSSYAYSHVAEATGIHSPEIKYSMAAFLE